jgi:hypothetical protein
MQKSKGNQDCLFIRNKLFSYQEKQLSGKERVEFEDHLHFCEGCARVVSGFQSVTSLIDQKKSVEINAFILTRTLQRIESELNRGIWTPNLFFQRILQPVIVSLLFLFTIMISLSIGKQFNANYPSESSHQEVIETLKSDLFITDFMDENITAFNNP